MQAIDSHRGRRGDRCRCFILAALLIVIGAANAGAEEGQYWGRAGLSVEAAGSTFGLGLETRSEGEVADGHYYTQLTASAERPWGEHVKLGASYARVDKKGGSDWSTEHRPYADVVLRWKFSQLGVQDRNRLEVRYRDGDQALRYRNRFQLSHPLGGSGLSASVDDEVFVDLEDVEFNRNRVTSGIQMRMGNGVSLGVYHAFESWKSEESWTGFHALIASLNYSMKVQGRNTK